MLSVSCTFASSYTITSLRIDINPLSEKINVYQHQSVSRSHNSAPQIRRTFVPCGPECFYKNAGRTCAPTRRLDLFKDDRLLFIGLLFELPINCEFETPLEYQTVIEPSKYLECSAPHVLVGWSVGAGWGYPASERRE